MHKQTKLFGKAALTILCFSFFAAVANAGSFTDLSDRNRYAVAIEYLKEVGIINGYPDGTFKPDQNVNRVEFLKLVLESSEITTDIDTKTEFPDIDNTAWYAKYVRKAYKEGWIEGYPDGTFKPEQNINKVEALKIIGQVQKWETPLEITEQPYTDITLDEWYTPYISYAKTKNYLEENSNSYIPDAIQSRARVSELLFRSFITTKSESEEYSKSLAEKFPASLYVIKTDNPATEPPNTAPDENLTAVTYKTYEENFFDDITLNASFPNTYYLNEVYFIEGTVNKGTYDQAFVFLAPEGVTDDTYYLNFSAEVKNNKFSIPVMFKTAGNYSMGIILGNEGESNILDISVIPNLPNPLESTDTSSSITNLNLTYEDQNTTFSWDNKDNELTNLTVIQGKKSKTFYFRQNIEKFNIDYSDFKDFKTGSTTYTLKGAQLLSTHPLQIKTDWSLTAEKSFNASEHYYSTIDEDLISYNSFRAIKNDLGAIEISGITNTDIYAQAAITKPDGFVDTLMLTSPEPFKDFYNTKIIPSNNSYTFSYEPKTAGTYTVEINLTDGSAVLNTPVYINTGIPLLPNYFDLNPYIAPIDNFSLPSARNEFLEYINEARTEAGLKPVVIDNELNTLAQLHSDDMVERDFFNHVNPDGQTPNDRRIKQGILTAVGENLAISPTVEYTHKGLMQSGIHRKNILDDKWTRVGLGVAQDQDGSLLTTQEFSYEPLTNEDLNIISDEMFTQVNNARAGAEIAPLIINNDLNDAAASWSDIMADEEFFAFEAPPPSTNTLQKEINKFYPDNTVQALILESVNIDELIMELIKNPEILDPYWENVGFGLQLDNIGTLKATVLFSSI